MDKDLSNMSAAEIQAQIQHLEASKRSLEKALEKQKSRRKSDLAAKVRDLIMAEGFDVEEILELVDKKKRAGGGAEKAGATVKAYVDPDNPENIYTRGVLPGWMKARMQSEGLDPADRDDRNTFKASFLKAVIRNK